MVAAASPLLQLSAKANRDSSLSASAWISSQREFMNSGQAPVSHRWAGMIDSIAIGGKLSCIRFSTLHLE